MGKPDVLTLTKAFSYCRCVSGVTVPCIGPTEIVTGCTTLPGYLFDWAWKHLDAYRWRQLTQLLSLLFMECGSRVTHQRPMVCNLVIPVLVECRLNMTWFDLPVRLAVSMDACSNHWITVELEETFELMESSETECVRAGFRMFAGSHMRVLH